MEIIIKATVAEAQQEAARILRRQIHDKPDCVLGLATGSTPIGVYALLVEMHRRGEIDFALFFSPRTAAIFVGLATSAGLAECCVMITTVSISPAADAALSALPWRDRRVAEKPTQAALLKYRIHKKKGNQRHAKIFR